MIKAFSSVFTKKATIYALFSGKIEDFVNLASVKHSKNSTSADDLNKIEAWNLAVCQEADKNT